MGLQAIFFYLFAFVAIASAFMVISSRNPVHSVLFLILTFVNAAGLFMLTGAEFLAMILLVVYVGAVAVLFLFVVMMLDIDFTELRAGASKHGPLAALIGAIVAAELIFVIGGSVISPAAKQAITMPIPALADRQNTAALGDVLYTNYVFFFQILRPCAAGGHDRRDCADVASPPAHQAAEYCTPGCTWTGDCHQGGQGQARPGHLS